MTLSSTTTKTQYNGDGSTTAFASGFMFQANADVKVILTVTSTGVDTTQVLDTDYTLTGAGVAAGGTVTMTTAPATDERLTVKRAAAETQATDYPQGGAFPATSTEDALDKLTMLVQQHSEEFARALKLAESSTTSQQTLPEPAANKVLGWDTAGTALENKTATTVALVVVDDTTPQLGGNLDVNSKSIVSVSNGDILITANGTGQVKPGETNFQDALLIRPEIKDYAETTVDKGSLGDTPAFNVSAGNVQIGTNSATITSSTMTNWPATGKAGSLTLILTNGGAYSIAWPVSVDWAGGTPPTLTAAGVDILVFTSIDAGTTVHGMMASADSK